MPNQFTHAWTDEEITYITTNINKLTYKQMSIRLHRSPASIQSKIRFLPIYQKIKKYSVNIHYFKTWNAEMAYILGFIAADGNICHSGRAHTLHIACDDRDIIEKIKVAITYNGPIHQKIRSNGKISHSLRICDTTIFKDLLLLNITERKSLTIKPPIIPREYIKDFVRGYFDGDGSVSCRSQLYKSKLVVDFYTASVDMANFLHLITKQVTGDSYKGTIQKTLPHQKNCYYAIRVGHNAALKLFSYMYQDASIYIERKFNKFLQGITYA